MLVVALSLGDHILTEPEVTSSVRKQTMYIAMGDSIGRVDTFFDRCSFLIFILLTAAASALLLLPCKRSSKDLLTVG